MQPLEGNNLQTILIDAESGEEIKTSVNLPENADPQKMGSIITYFRRFALQSLFALQAEDDDGNKAKPTASTLQTKTNDVDILEPCPQCGKALALKNGSKGEFIACTGYPKCKFTRDVQSAQSQAQQENVDSVEGEKTVNAEFDIN